MDYFQAQVDKVAAHPVFVATVYTTNMRPVRRFVANTPEVAESEALYFQKKYKKRTLASAPIRQTLGDILERDEIAAYLRGDFDSVLLDALLRGVKGASMWISR